MNGYVIRPADLPPMTLLVMSVPGGFVWCPILTIAEGWYPAANDG